MASYVYNARIIADTLTLSYYKVDTNSINITSDYDSSWIYSTDRNSFSLFNKGSMNYLISGQFYTGRGIKSIDDIEIMRRGVLTTDLDNYDYWVIGPENWEWAVSNLMSHRASEGLKPIYIDIDDIYNDFLYPQNILKISS